MILDIYSTASLQITGPLKPWQGDYYGWYPVFYNTIVHRMYIKEANITYMDNTGKKIWRNEIMTALELMLYVKDWESHLYYHKDTKKFDFMPISSIELETLKTVDWNALDIRDVKISDSYGNNISFLTFDEIDHKELMSFFVKECVDDKEKRKKLFYTLRRHDYVDPFVAALKELELYDDFVLFAGNVYDQMFREWADKHGLEF